MKYYRDIIGASHDQILSDEFDIIYGDVIYEVKTKMITKDLNITINNNVGGVLSASGNTTNELNEDFEFESVEGTIQVNNLVESMRLVETSFDKRSYLTYIKGYIKDIVNKLKESNNTSRIEIFQKGATAFVKSVIDGENFKKFQFFTGASVDARGHVALMYYKDEEPTTPIFIFFGVDGLESVNLD